MNMEESSQNRQKTLLEKEKLLVVSNFSFFQRFQTTSTVDTLYLGLFGKRLMYSWPEHSLYIQDQNTAFNLLSNGKISDCSKLKAFADDEINVADMMISLSDRAENIVG